MPPAARRLGAADSPRTRDRLLTPTTSRLVAAATILDAARARRTFRSPGSCSARPGTAPRRHGRALKPSSEPRAVTISAFSSSGTDSCLTAPEAKEAFEALKPEIDPQLILTHTRNDLHQDHRTVCELTWNTFRDHLILEYEVPKYDGDLGRPGVYVELSADVAREKVELLLRHFPSQSVKHWFDAETFTGVMRLRGLEAKAKDGYAEAFYGPKLVVSL